MATAPVYSGSAYDDPNLSAARGAAQSASDAYGKAQQAAYTLPDMLKEALSKKLGADNPVVANRESALKNYFTASGNAPLEVTPRSAGGLSDYVFNPAQQQALIQAKRGAALAPVSSANALFGLEVGGLPDIINSTSNAYQGQVAGMKNTADQLWQTYQALFGEAQQRAAEQAAHENLAFKYAELNKPSKGGSADSGIGNILAQYLMAMKSPGATVQPTEPKPSMTPSSTVGGRIWTSPQGQWAYDASSKDWFPVGD